MIRKALLSLTVIVGASIVFMAFLYAIASNVGELIGNFRRNVIPGFVTEEHSLEINENSYLLGRVNGHYLIAQQNELRIIEMTGDLKVVDTISIEVSDSVHFMRPSIEIDSPFFYIKDGARPGLFKGIIGEWSAMEIFPKCPYFLWAVSMSDSAFAIQTTVRYEGDSLRKNVLGIIDKNGFMSNPEILASDDAADFYDSKGVVRYNKQRNILIYTHFYRCKNLVLDSNLDVLYEFNTIDNVDTAGTKAIEVDEGVYTLAAPQAVINMNSQVVGDFLFVHSNVRSASESEMEFDSNSVIDVYAVDTGKYLYSFHVPFYRMQSVESFKVSNNMLIAKQGKNIILYSMSTRPVL